MSADRGAFICQSQSLNLFINNCDAGKLTSAHFYAWKKGLKTGMYYLRTKAAIEAIAGLGVDLSKLNQEKTEAIELDEYKAMLQKAKAASESDEEDCVMCGS